MAGNFSKRKDGRKILMAKGIMPKIISVLVCAVFWLAKPAFADKQLDGEFFYAVSQGDTAKVETMLAQGADPNAHSGVSGFSALMAACLFSDDALARILVKAGADVNQRTLQGESALYYAIVRNNTEMALMLLENGAQTQIKTIAGDTLYQAARRHNNARLMTALGCAEKNSRLENYPPLANRTSLSLLNEKDEENARNEALLLEAADSAYKLLVYPLGFNYVQNLLNEIALNKTAAPKTLLVTPYSLLRYTFAYAQRSGRPAGRDAIRQIRENKEIAWLWVEPGERHPHIERVTLKAGKNEYQPLSRTFYTPDALVSALGTAADNIWAFPAGIFSRQVEVLEIIIAYPDGKRDKVKLKAELYEKLAIK
ncbi:MAG: ankyrin repeat domain-containing protein [Acidaminococcales bacterium]|jgi:hypothetical protein|nr:ankyrin repeat domain-containing protein [Acidaminococcales bacterium]